MNRYVKLKEALRRTPLRKAWWKITKLPGIKQLNKKHWYGKRDKRLDSSLPDIYRAHLSEPVDEDKVLFIDLRSSVMTDNFKLIYDWLMKDTERQWKLHVHCLDKILSSTDIFEERCKIMAADAATAKYIFLNDASEEIGCLPMRPETVVTQVWHACGAFKRWGMSTAEKGFGYNAEQQMRHPNYANLTHVTVSSPEVVWAYAEAMSLKGQEDVIKPIGVSRTDIFYDEAFRQQAFDHLYRLFPLARGKKVILYAPTFRGSVKKARSPAFFHIERFAEVLGDEYVLVTKHHPFVRKFPLTPGRYRRTFFMNMTKEMSIEELLVVSDICISDYSSLIFEYSLFERPMIFYNYDYDAYFDNRGFYYDYETLTPGPKFDTCWEMIDYIQHIDERFDKKRVQDFREKFMSACDGHATERLCEMLFRGKEFTFERVLVPGEGAIDAERDAALTAERAAAAEEGAAG